MNKELNEVLINVQMLFDTYEISRKIDKIREEYKRSTIPETESVMGHTFSSKSFAGFAKAVQRNTKDQEEDFRQYINRLMFEKNVTQATISRRSLIKDFTLSRYINGSRDIPTFVMFRIALSLKLNLIETETLLRKKGKAFKKAKMDAVIMEAIEQGIFDVIKVEAVLRQFTDGEESLFTKKEMDEFEFNDEDLEIEVI